ncbi:GNAT family N-acetyltransferase [[Mycobacterium] kokjensenii]|uniref:GNAT family N-acetyltransferase n=1 Tax=[Mycobacterium] kokjensenii TaxID=3064287 RepID=A0ABM9L6V9_9MYCO|nr:GNAT family N-acetyltransferase [Mycolicibacter sp. MU0083]CAJ1493508.1 GNAT family N-acetyltransferase [Mycolicibacter sp. MU0083]
MTDRPPELPEIGVRVSLRYLRPPGSEPPMGDVVGHLVQSGPLVRIRSADGVVHECRHADVLYVRRLTDRPVKNSAIRSVEHAAALACTGDDHLWLDGWLLRAAPGAGPAANSAIPLDMFAHVNTVPAIIDWYAHRGLPPYLAVPERLLRLPEDLPVMHETRTLVCDLGPGTAPDGVVVTSDGDVCEASIPGAASGRGAVTDGSDGTRWLGLTQIEVAAEHRGRGCGRRICTALRVWGTERGATRAYAQVPSTETGAFAFFEAVGFAGQHRTRYLDARALGWLA